MPLCWPHLHNDVLHVVVLLGVQEGRELLLGGCQVPILVGHLEAPLVPHHHLFVVEAIVRVRIVWEGAQGAPRSARAGEGPWYPPTQHNLNPTQHSQFHLNSNSASSTEPQLPHNFNLKTTSISSTQPQLPPLNLLHITFSILNFLNATSTSSTQPQTPQPPQPPPSQHNLRTLCQQKLNCSHHFSPVPTPRRRRSCGSPGIMTFPGRGPKRQGSGALASTARGST